MLSDSIRFSTQKISSTVLPIPMVRLAISITVPVVLPSLRMLRVVKPITMADRVR